MIEQQPTFEYIKGYNQGYELETYEPNLVRSVFDKIQNKEGKYFEGFSHGRADAMMKRDRHKNPNRHKGIEKRKDIGLDR